MDRSNDLLGTFKLAINHFPINIFDKIIAGDHNVYRALLGIYKFGMWTLNNFKKYQVAFRITVQFNEKWNVRRWERRSPGKCHVVIKNNNGAEYLVNGVKYCFETPYGGFQYFDDQGKEHREDGPAVKIVKGREFTLKWMRHGHLHRDDGPAVETSAGRKEWHCHGRKYRKDGPAIEAENGDKFWCEDCESYKDPQMSKIEYADGTKVFYTYDGEHICRIEYANGPIECWFQNSLSQIDASDGTIAKLWFEHGNRHMKIQYQDKTEKYIGIVKISTWADVYCYLPDVFKPRVQYRY